MATPGYISPELQLPSAPVDAGGGVPGSYTAEVLDLFKFGIGAWQANKAQNNLLDYKRYEAINGGLSQQGAPSANRVNGGSVGSGGMNTTTLLLIAGGVAVVGFLLLRK